MNHPTGQDTLRVRVCIPHYVREQGGDQRYGSGQPQGRAARALALGRCLAALLDLQRGAEDCLLHIGARAIQRLPSERLPRLARPHLSLSITVCTDGVHQLDDVLALFADDVEVRSIQLDDPRHLALACRDLLLGGLSPETWSDAPDLYLYLEDDLVIRDPLYLDKMAWFLERSGHAWVLMPHRYERIHRDGLGVMLVDGPKRNPAQARIPVPDHLARLQWPGQDELRLEIPGNPHSGTFCLSRAQVERIGDSPLPRSGFVGPLETAATQTALQFFPVLKPVPAHWRSLCLEHGHAGHHHHRHVMPEFNAHPAAP